MKGFILALQRAKNEDMIATILSEDRIERYYRFYGARHSILQLGYLIDFEREDSRGRFLPRLRGLRHLGFPWLYERNRLAHWHDFIRHFELHLRDAGEVDRFYFHLLLEAARRWARQNPRRIAVESYHSLLHFEGRLHPADTCYICNKPLGKSIGVMYAFHLAHPECIYTPPIDRSVIDDFFRTGKTTYMDDATVAYLYAVIQKGF